jgi:glycosyltransferase involved in cell wall biosynthesis
MKKISFIIPVYNEEKNVPLIAAALENLMKKDLVSYTYEIIFINDGSKDGTLREILKLVNNSSTIHYINLSKNFGQRNAIKAAINLCNGDCAISLDGDMQHPIELIPEMLSLWEQDNQVVYTLREEDTSLSFVKRYTSKVFHKIISFLSGIDVEYGLSDFRLLDRKVINVFKQLTERELFWRGMVKWTGFNQTSIKYKPNQRIAGETSYNIIGLFLLAIKSIVSFSVKPLYLVIYIGILFVFLSLCYLPYILYSAFMGIAVSGWTSLIMIVIFLGGFQLIMLGIIGYYIGELFLEVKNRPTFIISETSLE